MANTETNLNTLVINVLTEEQYQDEIEAGTIDEDALYLTTDNAGVGVTDVEVDGTSVVSDGVAEIDLSGKSDVGHTHTKSDISDFPTLATVATSGSYTDLLNKPTIPTITDTYSGTSSNGMSGKAVKSAIDALDGSVSGSAGSGKTLTAFSQTNGVVSATFGNISITKSQVSDFPTIPTITDTYSGTSSNGMSGKAVKSAIDALDGSVSGSAGSGKTLTSFSQTDGKVSATFENISITKSQVSDFPTIPTVPTNVSDFVNDAGYITGYTETDPVFTSSASYGITTTDIDNWDSGYIELDTSAASGIDHDLYAALVTLGWTDCIVV